MTNIVISVEHLTKQYDLGVIGTGTLSRDLNRWWARLRGAPDPYTLIIQRDHFEHVSVRVSWRWVVDVNPITPIVETFRARFLGAGNVSWLRLGYSGLFMLVVLFIGVIIFNRVEKTFIDTV